MHDHQRVGRDSAFNGILHSRLGEGKPMPWPAESAALIGRMLRAAGEPAFGIAASCTAIVLFLALLALAGRHRRLKRTFAAQAPSLERSAATTAGGEHAMLT